jgi:molecular chaperone GrpE (heat shock protein)
VESDEHDSNQIVEEMRKGYMIGDRLLRAARVVVAK